LLLNPSLPDAEGLDGIRMVARSAPRLAVVTITDSANEAYGLATIANGGQDFIDKEDATDEALVRTIRHAIERKTFESAPAHQSTHDPLTGLANRVLFLDRLSHALARRERTRTVVAVLYIDLEGFKPVNDTYGLDVGDEVLVEVARRLAVAIRPYDTVARLSGDEFAACCEGLSVASHAEPIAARIADAASRPIPITDGDGETHLVCVGASVGVATAAAGEPIGLDALIARAGKACGRAKRAGRDRSEVDWPSFSRP
jgi:diguanylate cyclase (GGDEF)-like protein